MTDNLFSKLRKFLVWGGKIDNKSCEDEDSVSADKRNTMFEANSDAIGDTAPNASPPLLKTKAEARNFWIPVPVESSKPATNRHPEANTNSPAIGFVSWRISKGSKGNKKSFSSPVVSNRKWNGSSASEWVRGEKHGYDKPEASFSGKSEFRSEKIRTREPFFETRTEGEIGHERVCYIMRMNQIRHRRKVYDEPIRMEQFPKAKLLFDKTAPWATEPHNQRGGHITNYVYSYENGNSFDMSEETKKTMCQEAMMNAMIANPHHTLHVEPGFFDSSPNSMHIPPQRSVSLTCLGPSSSERRLADGERGELPLPQQQRRGASSSEPATPSFGDSAQQMQGNAARSGRWKMRLRAQEKRVLSSDSETELPPSKRRRINLGEFDYQ